jgi:hypothetical protein
MKCIEGKGGLKDICCITQNIALFVSLLYNFFCNYLKKRVSTTLFLTYIVSSIGIGIV